ncbi:MAG: hypothetical protein PVG06_09480 [Desulfobacterales bacterium]|jgi:hypothetical protein
MLNFIDTIIAVFAVMVAWFMVRAHLRITQKNSQSHPITTDDYIQKLTQATGIRTYETFCISAEEWRVSADRIDQDFRRYLSSQSIPFYVKDFIRKDQTHIDELYRNKGNSLTDKRMWLVYSFLLVFFWGGAFFLSLYVFPNIWPEDFRASIHFGPP